MASTVYFSLFTAFIIAFIQSVTSGSLYEWNVERSSVNPFSYTEEIRYSSDRTTQSPAFAFFRRRLNCPENEHFARCDADCQTTCDNYKERIRCPRACAWGCVCNIGFVRGPDNKCIKPKDCPAKTNAETQHFYVTLNPSPYTDDGYHIPLSGTRSPRDSETENPQFEETEIPPITHSKVSHKCPGPRQRWVTCFAHCQRNCSNKDDKKFDCRPVCISGCICEKGLVVGPDGTCIEKEKCPAISDSEENSYVTLNPPPYTDDDYHIPSSGTKSPLDSETDNPQFQETEIPSISHTNFYATLNPTYYTEGDYHISESRTRNPLISATENPQFEETEIPPRTQTKPSHECPPRERYVPCGRDCQRNCSNKDDKDFGCKPICVPGCICEVGLVKGPDGKCIEKDKCPDKLDSEQLPSHECRPRERYVPCGRDCQRNCSNKDDEDFGCKPVCVPGCICEEGLVKGPNGKCIEKDKCPDNLDSEKVSENQRLKISPNAGCSNDNECTMSCRQYGHRFGHCTGRNNAVCSCYLENYENAENEKFQAGVNPCPDDKTCRKLCRMTIEMKGGECVGPNNNTCRCY